MTQTTPERKPCGTCGKPSSVNADGTIRHHLTDNPEFQAGPDSRKCRGAGEKPAGATEETSADAPQCRLCKHPVELTGNGRARSHLTPEATPRTCPGGSDFPLGTYPDIVGTTDGIVATLARDCEHVPVGECYDCAGVAVPNPTAEAQVTSAAPWGVDPSVVAQPTMADQLKAAGDAQVSEAAQQRPDVAPVATDVPQASAFLALLEKEAAGAGTVLDRLPTAVAVKVPEQPSARVEHKYTDPSGVEWIHPGPEESCQSPDCVMTRMAGDEDGYKMDVYGRYKNGGVYCEQCDTDTHRCPGCGTDVKHGTVACSDCSARVAKEDAERQAKCTHPDGFRAPLVIGGHEVPACEHCNAVAPAAEVNPDAGPAVPDTGWGRNPDFPDPELPNCPHPETHRAGCVCPDDDSRNPAETCTHPDGYGAWDALDGNGNETVVEACLRCGALAPGEVDPDEGWRTPADTVRDLMPEDVQGLDALRLNCDTCNHLVTPLVEAFDLYGKAKAVLWCCEQAQNAGALSCDNGGHQCVPDTRVLLGDLEIGEHFIRRGVVMRVTAMPVGGDVHAVVVEGSMKGREGGLKDWGEAVERTHCRHKYLADMDFAAGEEVFLCDYCGAEDPATQPTTEQETKECTDNKAAQTSPRSSAGSTSTTTSLTTAPAPGSRPGTEVSVPTVLPDSLRVTSSAPTDKAATSSGSAAVTTDQADAAARFLGGGRPAAATQATGALSQADAAAQFLAGGSGAHGEKETKRDRFGRYLIPHPDTGREQAWTRATTFAKSISDTYALGQWGLRMALLGATMRPDIVQRAHGKHVSADKQLLDELTAELKNAAGDKVAANLGTAMHSFTEMADRAWHSPGGPRSILDQVPPDCRADVETYIRLLEETGLEPVPHLIEFTTVVKQYGVAGTSDNCYRVTRPLTLKVGRGEVLLVPGEYVIGDKKTGRDLDYGWQEIAIQLGTYAQGLNTAGVWDRHAEEWRPDPLSGGKVRLDAGIVVHLPVDKSGKKQPAVYGIDLESGWNAAVLCERVRAWRKVRNLASPVMVSEAGADTFAPARPEPAVTSRTTIRPPTLKDRAESVTSKSEASEVWKQAKTDGLPDAEVDALVAIMQARLKKLAEPAG